MNIWEDIRNFFAERRERKEGDPKRSSKVVNLHEARSVAFLYHSKDEATFILVKQFAERIASTFGTRRTMALGFVSEKETPVYHSHVLHSDYFTKKELNWYGFPSGAAVEAFVTEDFDIIIDLSEGDITPLRSILGRSVARFKVGRNPDDEHYDLIIPIRTGATLDSYLKRIIDLLSQINYEKTRIA